MAHLEPIESKTNMNTNMPETNEQTIEYQGLTFFLKQNFCECRLRIIYKMMTPPPFQNQGLSTLTIHNSTCAGTSIL